jgi:hypothetical protein
MSWLRASSIRMSLAALIILMCCLRRTGTVLIPPPPVSGVILIPWWLARSFDQATGSRIFENLEDGTWWHDTHALVNSGQHSTPRKVFPINIYVDETHLTQDGNFKATPVLVQAGKVPCCQLQFHPTLYQLGFSAPPRRHIE